MDIKKIGDVVYEKEVQELKAKTKAKGIILVVIEGDRNTNVYECATAVDSDKVAGIPGFLFALAIRIARDLENFFNLHGKNN